MHTVIGLQEVALVVTVALCGGLLLERLGQPSVLGYILAGIFLGPSGIGYIEDHTIIQLFADFGILMVLFVIGMRLNLQSFKRTLLLSTGAMFGQVSLSLATVTFLAWLFAWPMPFVLLVTFMLALSSTAVAVKMLEASYDVSSDIGRLTIGILIAQDLAIVPMILILKGVGSGIQWSLLFFKITFAVGILSLFVWYLSRPQRLNFFFRFPSDSPELPALVGLAFCFGFATLSGLIELSVAYGAFLAGLILGNSKERPLMLQVIMPIYSVLFMTFFLSVGLFINIHFIWKHLSIIFFVSSSVLILKTLANFGILRLLGQPWPVTFFSGVILSQLGEFAFLLVAVGKEAGMLDPYQQQLLLTLTAISLGISPLWLSMSARLRTYHLQSQATFGQTLLFYSKLVSGWGTYVRKKLGRRH